MRYGTFLLALVSACVVFLLVRHSRSNVVPESPRPINASGVDVLPVCPWRDPQRDLSALFPGATNYLLESRIVSGMTVEIVKRLGRHMNTGENPLRIYRVHGEGQTSGSVLVTRVRGEHGGIEIVIAVNPESAVTRVLIQSQREPELVAHVITNSAWLTSFVGKNARSPLRVGEDLPPVAAEARQSAQAVADGVRSQLIVLSFADGLNDSRESQTHTHR